MQLLFFVEPNLQAAVGVFPFVKRIDGGRKGGGFFRNGSELGFDALQLRVGGSGGALQALSVGLRRSDFLFQHGSFPQ